MRNFMNAIDICNTLADLRDRVRVAGIVAVRMFSDALVLDAGYLGTSHQPRWQSVQSVFCKRALCLVPSAAVVGTSVSATTPRVVRRSERLETPSVLAAS